MVVNLVITYHAWLIVVVSSLEGSSTRFLLSRQEVKTVRQTRHSETDFRSFGDGRRLRSSLRKIGTEGNEPRLKDMKNMNSFFLNGCLFVLSQFKTDVSELLFPRTLSTKTTYLSIPKIPVSTVLYYVLVPRNKKQCILGVATVLYSMLYVLCNR